MDWLLRRNFWIVKALAVVAVAAFVVDTSLAVADLMAGDPVIERPEGATAELSATVGTPRDPERLAARILGYNGFCPRCGPTPPPAAEGGQSVDADQDLSGARRSALPLVVAATMEHRDPARSVATLIDTERGVGGLFGVGDLIGGRVEIVHVATGVVHVSNNGVLEYIPLQAEETPPPKRAEPTTKPAEPAAPPKSYGIDGAEEAIQCTDRGDCVVDRAFVEKLFADPKLLVGQGGASPATTKDGTPGFRLRGVKRGTLPDLLGLKNGDVITEVGGSALTMDKVAGLYTKLRHASHVEVTVDRRGERVRRQLEIRS